jgi:hypothetical protein
MPEDFLKITCRRDIPFVRISGGDKGCQFIEVNRKTAKALGVLPRKHSIEFLERASLVRKAFISAGVPFDDIKQIKKFTEEDRNIKILNVCNKLQRVVWISDLEHLKAKSISIREIDPYKYFTRTFSLFHNHLLSTAMLTGPQDKDCWIRITPGLEPFKFVDESDVTKYLEEHPDLLRARSPISDLSRTLKNICVAFGKWNQAYWNSYID